MFRLALLFGLMLVAAFAVGLVVIAPDLPDNLPLPAANSVVSPPEIRPVRPSGEAAIGRTVRDVTPQAMTSGPAATGPVARIEPPAHEQLTPKPRTERLYNPVVTAAGLIKARGRDFRLAGISAPDFEVRCGEGTAAWPCGRMARAALRRFVRGRAIECIVPAGADEIPNPAECRVAGGEDLAAWLVAQGWARAKGATYEALEAKAREEKLGLWGEARPG
jgi:endonuclease YncB( thermonuclease family)